MTTGVLDPPVLLADPVLLAPDPLLHAAASASMEITASTGMYLRLVPGAVFDHDITEHHLPAMVYV
jgi:hypothetical protein